MDKFKLSENFISKYKRKKAPFGFRYVLIIYESNTLPPYFDISKQNYVTFFIKSPTHIGQRQITYTFEGVGDFV